MAEEINELKKLSPKERIERLKKLQEKNKEEIEKAQSLLKEAEQEAKIEDELRDIPIPQLKAVDIEGLFSPEERELFKAKRFISPKKKQEPGEPAREEKQGELESIAEQAPRLKQQEEQQHVEYINQLSRQPTEHLYNRASALYDQFKQQGNQFNPQQQQEFNNIEYANRQKFQAIKSGRYTEVSQEVAQEMSLIEKMKGAMYKR